MLEIIPKNTLPPLGSLIDTEESSIELTDEDLGNDLTEEEQYREEELYDLTDEDFGNDYEEDEEEDSNYEFGVNIQEEDNVQDNYNTNDYEENNYEEKEENYSVPANQEKEERYEEVKPAKKSKTPSNKIKPNIDFKKYYKIAIGVAITIFVIILFIVLAKFINKKVKETKANNKTPVQTVEETKEQSKDTEKENSFNLSEKDGLHYVTIKLSDNDSGIYQVVYKRKDNKIIVCETIVDDYSGNEAKEVELSCYNMSNEDSFKDMEKISENFISE